MNDSRSKRRFENGGGSLELDAAIEEEASLQPPGNACATSLVQAGGLGGHDDLWVRRSKLPLDLAGVT